MANVIRFVIKTADSYSEAEQEDLLNSFVEFMNEVDGSIVEDSESVIIADENDDVISHQVQSELESTILAGTVFLRSDDGRVLRKLEFTEGDFEDSDSE